MTPKKTKKYDKYMVERLMVGCGWSCECTADYCDNHEGGEKCGKDLREGYIPWPPRQELTDYTTMFCVTCAFNRAKSEGRDQP